MVGETKPEHPLHPRRPFNRRQLLMQAVVAVVILVSGIGIGAGGTVLALKNRIVTGVRLLPVGPPGPEPNFLVERWRGDYGLSDKQAQQVKTTLTKQFKDARELRQKFMQTEQVEQEKFAASMKKILTAEQYAKWEADLKKRMEHFRGMRPFDGRGGGRGGPRGERPDRPMDPNGRRWDGPPRPQMDGEGRRGWSPRGPMDPNGRRGNWPGRGPDRAMNRPAELKDRPADVNAPK